MMLGPMYWLRHWYALRGARAYVIAMSPVYKLHIRIAKSTTPSKASESSNMMGDMLTSSLQMMFQQNHQSNMEHLDYRQL